MDSLNGIGCDMISHNRVKHLPKKERYTLLKVKDFGFKKYELKKHTDKEAKQNTMDLSLQQKQLC